MLRQDLMVRDIGLNGPGQSRPMMLSFSDMRRGAFC